MVYRIVADRVPCCTEHEEDYFEYLKYFVNKNKSFCFDVTIRIHFLKV